MISSRLTGYSLSRHAGQPFGVGLGVLLLLTGCPSSGEDSFAVDSSTPEPEEETTECSPSLSKSGVAAGTSDTLGDFARFSFTWANGGCNGLVSGGTLQAHSINLDAEDPNAAEANIYYDFPMATANLEGARITLDTTNLTASVDLPLDENADEYEVTVTVVDSLGFLSNALLWDVVYKDIPDVVE